MKKRICIAGPIFGSLLASSAIASAAQGDVTLSLAIIGDDTKPVIGVPILVQDPALPPGLPGSLRTNLDGSSDFIIVEEASTYVAHLAEFSGGHGFYSGASYALDIPSYSTGIAGKSYRKTLSQNRMELLPILRTTIQQGTTPPSGYTPVQSQGFGQVDAQFFTPPSIDNFWTVGVVGIFEESFDLWIGVEYHAEGINRFLNYYGVANNLLNAERAIILRTKHDIHFSGTLGINISTSETSMTGGVRPTVRAIVIGTPGAGTPQDQSSIQFITHGTFEVGNDQVWVNLSGYLHEGFTLLLLEPGTGSESHGDVVAVEAYHEASVPDFGTSSGWVTYGGSPTCQDKLAMADAKADKLENTAVKTLGLEPFEGQPVGKHGSALLAHALDGGPPCDGSGEDCELDPPTCAVNNPPITPPSPPTNIYAVCPTEADGVKSCSASAHDNGNTVCMQVCEADYNANNPPSQDIEHKKGKKITLGAVFGTDGVQVSAGREYTTEETTTTHAPFAPGANNQGQCWGSFTCVTSCEQDYCTYGILWKWSWLDFRWEVDDPCGDEDCKTYTSEQETITWLHCDRLPTPSQ